MPRASSARRAIRTIAAIEAAKGVVVLLAATGLLSLLHADLGALAARLVRYSHLNPASHYPRIFIDAASQLQTPRLLWLALGAIAYAVLRLLEGWGLYHERAWAEWLAAGSGAVYVPIELAEVLHQPTALGLGVMAANIAVVGVMVMALRARRAAAHVR
ncbi:DUF2127 domain-containing protein [Rubrivivax gelatinosus]|uniref:Uncharacterized membrane protein (DUF2068 family) n=1 Tax=Rubrivivax gelatinosus TaxID=28068 RepID=A0A4R2M637_RUBGE|nr:DUF2127 domain-containing protein [Rubrivivax gelatinosus]MBK1689226.1 hypothetical protein [Rubrivivax gelatinosus]TCP02052.1 uncharacterized membrane protein (DUF2068 family) [Rubrivivax gelatinosus]